MWAGSFGFPVVTRGRNPGFFGSGFCRFVEVCTAFFGVCIMYISCRSLVFVGWNSSFCVGYFFFLL